MSESDEFEDELQENVTECPACQLESGHDILRERKMGKGVDFLVRCHECSNVHTIEFREPAPAQIPFILTDGPTSELVELELDADEILEVGDRFEDSDMEWKIHRIDDKEGNPRTTLRADKVARVNALRTDMIRVRLTMTRGERSISDSILVPEGEQFSGGNLIDVDGEEWRIRAIHTGSGRTLKGTVSAEDIRRIYLHAPEITRRPEPKTPQERRQAWKEGRLGYNPEPEIPTKTHRISRPNNRRRKRPRN